MKPVMFSECVAIGDVRPHVGISSCLSVCDIAQSPRRCKTGLIIEPTLSPVSFRDSLVIYKDSSRRRYRSIVYYEPRLRPRVFHDTCYILPRPPPESSFASINLDAAAAKAAAANGRRWFTTSLTFDKNKELACGGVVTVDGGSGHVVSRDGERACNGDRMQDSWKGTPRANGNFEKSNGTQSTIIEVNVTPANTNPGDRIVLMTSDRDDIVVASDVNNNPDDEDDPVSDSYLIRWPSGVDSTSVRQGAPLDGTSTYRTRMKIEGGRTFK